MAALTRLTELTFFGNNRISDLAPLAGLTNLTELFLDGNQISDLDPLAALTNLIDLRLFNNQISDLIPLAGMTNLIRLFLEGNRIVDLAPLAGLINLTTLQLIDNPDIRVLTLVALTKALPELDIAIDNLPPAITSQPDSTATVGIEYRSTIEVVDVNPADNLSFSLTTFPQGMTIDAAAGIIRWTPSGTQAGANPVAVRVFDGRKGTTQTFEILVEDEVDVETFTDPKLEEAVLEENWGGRAYSAGGCGNADLSKCIRTNYKKPGRH